VHLLHDHPDDLKQVSVLKLQELSSVQTEHNYIILVKTQKVSILG